MCSTYLVVQKYKSKLISLKSKCMWSRKQMTAHAGENMEMRNISYSLLMIQQIGMFTVEIIVKNSLIIKYV